MTIDDKLIIINKVKEILNKYIKENPDSALTKRPKIYNMESWGSRDGVYWIDAGQAMNFLEISTNQKIIRMNNTFMDPIGNQGRMNGAYWFIDAKDDELINYWVFLYLYEKGDSYSCDNASGLFDDKVYKPHWSVKDIWPKRNSNNRYSLRKIWKIDQAITGEMLIETLAKYIITLIEEDAQWVLDNMAIVNVRTNIRSNVCEMWDKGTKLFTVYSLEDGLYEKVVY